MRMFIPSGITLLSHTYEMLHVFFKQGQKKKIILTKRIKFLSMYLQKGNMDPSNRNDEIKQSIRIFFSFQIYKGFF